MDKYLYSDYYGDFVVCIRKRINSKKIFIRFNLGDGDEFELKSLILSNKKYGYNCPRIKKL